MLWFSGLAKGHNGVIKRECWGCCIFGLKPRWRNMLCFWSQEAFFIQLPEKFRGLLKVWFISKLKSCVSLEKGRLCLERCQFSWPDQSFSNFYLATRQILSCGSRAFYYILMWAHNRCLGAKSEHHVSGWVFVRSQLLRVTYLTCWSTDNHHTVWSSSVLFCAALHPFTAHHFQNYSVNPEKQHSVNPPSRPAKSGLSCERRWPQYLTTSSGQRSCTGVHVRTHNGVM